MAARGKQRWQELTVWDNHLSKELNEAERWGADACLSSHPSLHTLHTPEQQATNTLAPTHVPLPSLWLFGWTVALLGFVV